MNIAYNCDCMEYMKTLSDKHFDLAIVDPPYGLPKDSSNGRGKLKGRAFNQGHIATWDVKPSSEYFEELFRVSHNQIIWGGQLLRPASDTVRPRMGQGSAVGKFLAGGNRVDEL